VALLAARTATMPLGMISITFSLAETSMASVVLLTVTSYTVCDMVIAGVAMI
jgi:hypothetical protein